jgi:hypothetical protein
MAYDAITESNFELRGDIVIIEDALDKPEEKVQISSLFPLSPVLSVLL